VLIGLSLFLHFCVSQYVKAYAPRPGRDATEPGVRCPR